MRSDEQQAGGARVARTVCCSLGRQYCRTHTKQQTIGSHDLYQSNDVCATRVGVWSVERLRLCKGEQSSRRQAEGQQCPACIPSPTCSSSKPAGPFVPATQPKLCQSGAHKEAWVVCTWARLMCLTRHADGGSRAFPVCSVRQVGRATAPCHLPDQASWNSPVPSPTSPASKPSRPTSCSCSSARHHIPTQAGWSLARSEAPQAQPKRPA